MTEENYLYRTSPLMLRNQFLGSGHWHIPIIPKTNFTDDEFHNLRLIGYDRTKPDDERNLDRMVHFFLYDYKFERIWKRPDQDVEFLEAAQWPYQLIWSVRTVIMPTKRNFS